MNMLFAAFWKLKSKIVSRIVLILISEIQIGLAANLADPVE